MRDRQWTFTVEKFAGKFACSFFFVFAKFRPQGETSRCGRRSSCVKTLMCRNISRVSANCNRELHLTRLDHSRQRRVSGVKKKKKILSLEWIRASVCEARLHKATQKEYARFRARAIAFVSTPVGIKRNGGIIFPRRKSNASPKRRWCNYGEKWKSGKVQEDYIPALNCSAPGKKTRAERLVRVATSRSSPVHFLI